MAERRCFVCNHIFENTRAVCHVVFFDDGEIQVDCGQDDHGDADEFSRSFCLVGLNHIVVRDESLPEIFRREKPNTSFGRNDAQSPWISYVL